MGQLRPMGQRNGWERPVLCMAFGVLPFVVLSCCPQAPVEPPPASATPATGHSVAEGPKVPTGYAIERYASGPDDAKLPVALAFSPKGFFGRDSELYVAFAQNGAGTLLPKTYRVPSKGTTVLFGKASDQLSMEFPARQSAFGGYLYATSYRAGGVVRFDGDGIESLFAKVDGWGVYGARFGPGGRWGTDFYAMEQNGTIQRFDPNGRRTYLTKGLPANNKGFDFGPGGDWGDCIYVPSGGRIDRVDSNGVITDFLSGSTSLGSTYLVSLAFDRHGDFGGDMFVSSLDNNIYRVRADGKVTVFASEFNFGSGNTSTGDILFGPDGSMYVADGMNNAVWRIYAIRRNQ